MLSCEIMQSAREKPHFPPIEAASSDGVLFVGGSLAPDWMLEAWQAGRLAGGLFGVPIGSFFAAESMFPYATDASKAALAHLIEHLRSRGSTPLDVQWTNSPPRHPGATDIPRTAYIARLADA